MPGFGDIVQKAFYLGVGAAAYAAERAGSAVQELKVQAQKLADEMVERGEMTTDEARKFVDDLVKQAQQKTPVEEAKNTENEPRRIEILSEDEDVKTEKPENLDALRQQVQALQEELRRLNRN